MADVDNQAWKKTGFGQAQHKSQYIKLVLRLHEAHQHGDDAPRNHYAGNPTAGAPLLDQDAAGNLEQKIAPEKNAGAEAENLISERQLVLHLQRRIADVNAIEISNDKEDEKVGSKRRMIRRRARSATKVGLACTGQQMCAPWVFT
jgi:hypothetical protein